MGRLAVVTFSHSLVSSSAFAVPRAPVHTVAEAHAALEHLIAWEWSHGNFPEGQNRANARGEVESVTGAQSVLQEFDVC